MSSDQCVDDPRNAGAGGAGRPGRPRPRPRLARLLPAVRQAHAVPLPGRGARVQPPLREAGLTLTWLHHISSNLIELETKVAEDYAKRLLALSHLRQF